MGEDKKVQLTALEKAAEVANSAKVTEAAGKPVPLKRVKHNGKNYWVAQPCNFQFPKLVALEKVEVFGANTDKFFLGTSKNGVPKVFAPRDHRMIKKEVLISVALKITEVIEEEMSEAEQLAAFGL